MTNGDGRVVVVGAGPGGAATVTALRAEGHTGEIVLIGDEPHAPYDRPPLSKQVLAGTWPLDKVVLRTAADLAGDRVDFRASTRAASLDVMARRVDLDDGSTVGYDALVIATGVTARRLPFGHELAGIHLLRTLDDTVALRADLATAGPVVVIGAGFLGAEAAAVCRALGHQVSLVETADLPLQRVLGDELAAMVASLHRDHGVDLHLGRGVASFGSRAGAVRCVVLDDGTELAADVVVVAIGSEPAVEWLARSGIPLFDDHVGDSGIRCDEAGSAVDGVWAVGDVASWWDPQRGRHLRVEHRLTANEHARVVAREICGGERVGNAVVPYFWSDQYDLKLQSFGLPSSDDTCRVVEGSLTDRRFVAVYTDPDDRVTGVVGAGMAKAVRSWRGAIAAERPLTDQSAAIH